MKTAVVTGSSSGIGRAVSMQLLNYDFKVYGVSRRNPSISIPRLVWIKADLTKPHDIQKVVQSIHEKTIDVVVNAAGTAFKKLGLDLSKKDFYRIFDLNLLGPIYLVSALKGKLHAGLVINISSTSDRIPEKGYALYCSSKAALDMYFDVVVLEQKEIKIITLLPDYVDTPLLRKEVGNDAFDWSRAAQSDQVAEFIHSLVVRQKSYVSGTRIMILNNATLRSFARKEKLLAYNLDTKQFISSK